MHGGGSSVHEAHAACFRPVSGGRGRLRKPLTRRIERVRRQTAVALYVLALITVVVGVDVLFLRHRFWERLIANIGIVLVFGAFYLRFRLALRGK